MTVRFGILGAAGITPSALITPAHASPDVQLTAVAARSRAGAPAGGALVHGLTPCCGGALPPLRLT